MKKINLILIALVGMLFTGCMDDDWDAPQPGVPPYGNNSLTESNVVTIDELKNTFRSEIESGGVKQFTEPTQIKGVVTGNDIEGNIYNQAIVDDGTGAIIIAIAQGGLCGYLPVGQEILIELKDLYIGSYGKQPQIGTPYTNANGSTYVSRMSRTLWNSHFKLLNAGQLKEVKPAKVIAGKNGIASLDLNEDCGKLITLKDVELKDADGTAVFAPDDGSVELTANSANRSFKDISSSKLVLRTSTYADFANTPMPTGKVEVTGIFTRFRDTWQVIMRSESDIKQVNQ